MTASYPVQDRQVLLPGYSTVFGRAQGNRTAVAGIHTRHGLAIRRRIRSFCPSGYRSDCADPRLATAAVGIGHLNAPPMSMRNRAAADRAITTSIFHAVVIDRSENAELQVRTSRPSSARSARRQAAHPYRSRDAHVHFFLQRPRRQARLQRGLVFRHVYGKIPASK